MKIPFRYITRSLFRRLGSTLLTVSSFGLVIFSLVILLAMVEGVNEMLIASGAPDRILTFNENVTSENHSQLTAVEVSAISSYEGVKLTATGLPYASSEIVTTTYVNSPRGDRIQANFRGVDLEKIPLVHHELRIVDGRLFNPNAEDEVILGRQVFEALGIQLGSRFEAKQETWRVVGVFEEKGSVAESEIWTGSRNIALRLKKGSISSVWIRVNDPGQTDAVVQQLNVDPGLSVYAATETAHYAQGFATARGMQVLAWLIAGIMAVGAIFSAMNTMYASIADRTGELAAMRAIGFEALSVKFMVIIEAVIIALTGGVMACLLGWGLDGTTIRTILPGLGTVGFQFSISWQLLGIALSFAGLLGLVGGWVPARYAIKSNLVQALNS